MNTVKLIQGSDKWNEHRSNHLNASDIPVVMGLSSYKTRNELLDELSTGLTPETPPHLQKIFDEGHRKEALARVIIEEQLGEELYPVTVTKEIDGLNLSASLDGVDICEEVLFEHKSINEKLRKVTCIEELDDQYKVQMQQQMMVSGVGKCLFLASDGTSDDMIQLTFTYDSGMTEAIIEAWIQFKEDLADHKPKAKAPTITAKETESFPPIKCSVDGSLVVSNLGEYIPMIKALANEQMSVVLETDQDFADKEAFNKKVKESRKALKEQAKSIELTFSSLADFNGFVKEADGILQKLQSHGEKQVKESKEAKKRAFVVDAKELIYNFITEINESFGFPYIPIDATNWAEELKGKRNFDAMKNAIDSKVAVVKIEINQLAALVRANRKQLDETDSQYHPLFADHFRIVFKDSEDVKNLIETRINTHKAEQAALLEQQREQIRREEESKAREAAQAEIAKQEQAKQEKAADQRVAAKAATDKIAQAAVIDSDATDEIEKPIVTSSPDQKQVINEKPYVNKATHLTALLSEDGDGYNLYQGDNKVGYLNNIDFAKSVLINFE